ncbi:hypothetical protein Bbelb_111470 [Branchiostoma belcheri]|nr:hypothetical protein Bbelb_111470 [Branchiostoma belcheri]
MEFQPIRGGPGHVPTYYISSSFRDEFIYSKSESVSATAYPSADSTSSGPAALGIILHYPTPSGDPHPGALWHHCVPAQCRPESPGSGYPRSQTRLFVFVSVQFIIHLPLLQGTPTQGHSDTTVCSPVASQLRSPS